jgi:hypothetical protein
MAEKPKEKEKDTRSTRTKWLDSLPDNPMTTASRKISRLADSVGFTQEEQYKDKKYQVPETQKKKAGGTVKAKEGKWIQSAIKNPGSLRKQLGIKGDKKIPAKMLDRATKAPGKLGQRARLAKTLRGMK